MNCLRSKTVEPGVPWQVCKNIELYTLTIKEGGQITTPEGKYPVLTVNGVVKDIKPGVYKGDVRLTLSEIYKMPPHGLLRISGMWKDFYNAVVIQDNRLLEQHYVPAAVYGGQVSGEKTEDIYIACDAENFNGILVTGSSDYTINRAKMDLDGFGENDFIGRGAAVTAIDDAKVTINDSEFNMSGVTRCAVHVGGRSDVTLNRCKLFNHSPDTTLIDSFSWAVGFCGSNRLAQLTDEAKVTYNQCVCKTNGWGVLSIDGGSGVEMYVRDSELELTGPRAHGYGAFCIGDNTVTFDHTHVKVNGFPMLIMGEEGVGRANIINGSILEGRRFGVMIHKDENSIVTIRDSELNTDKSSICIKGSATTLNISNTLFHPKNGVVVQLMDNDEKSMTTEDFKIPAGVVDVRAPGRNLYKAAPTEDVFLNLSGCDITGDFFNSTTEIRACLNGTEGDCGMFMHRCIGARRMDGLDDGEGEPEHPRGHIPVAERHNGDDLQGSKNLVLNLTGTRIRGVISSASQKYRDGLALIDQSNRFELSNITQTAAPTINNGVILSLDSTSQWVVPSTSYITALSLEEGAAILAPEGKTLSMTVDGVPTPILPGRYQGTIVLRVE